MVCCVLNSHLQLLCLLLVEEGTIHQIQIDKLVTECGRSFSPSSFQSYLNIHPPSHSHHHHRHYNLSATDLSMWCAIELISFSFSQLYRIIFLIELPIDRRNEMTSLCLLAITISRIILIQSLIRLLPDRKPITNLHYPVSPSTF